MLRYAAVQFSLGVAVYMVSLVDNKLVYWLLGSLLCLVSLLVSIHILHHKTSLWASRMGKLKNKFSRHA